MVTSFKTQVLKVFRKHSLPRWVVLFIDLGLVFVLFYIAYLLRYNLEPEYVDLGMALEQSMLVMIVYAIFMLIVKSYSGLIRHTTIKDTYNLAVTTTLSLFVLMGISLATRMFNLDNRLNTPISILMIHYVMATTSLFFFRIFIKMFYEFVSENSLPKKNALIFGAGKMGVFVRNIVETDMRSSFRVAGFIDDNKRLQKKKVDGLLVQSPEMALNQEFIEKNSVSVLIAAINKLTPARKKQLYESALHLGLEIFETPSVNKWLNGEFSVKSLRKINLEDLLSRDPIVINLDSIRNGLFGKVILVTGAAGSIGSELARQICTFNVRKLILLDQAETPSFHLENELRCMGSCTYEFVIADVTNRARMEQVFSRYNPDVVFHAAAYKHVPIMEVNPHEALRVNVGGTINMAELSIMHKVGKFVMISTDKAVNPANVMGATKKLCEMVVESHIKHADSATQFVITRFGNVLGSNGSVIPLFRKQIERGGPVTLTHEDIERFFMTIPEACELVLEAGFMGNGGEIFVFDMGKPVKLKDVAIKLIHMAGLKPYTDIEIKVTGLRPGEKMYEELFATGEVLLPTHNPKISIARSTENNHDHIMSVTRELLGSLYNLSDEELIRSLQELVPGYQNENEPKESAKPDLSKVKE